MLLCDNLDCITFSICSNLNGYRNISLGVAISLNTNVGNVTVPDFLKSLLRRTSVCVWIITMDRIHSAVNKDVSCKVIYVLVFTALIYFTCLIDDTTYSISRQRIY